MGEQTSPLSTLDLSKINPYGASETQLNEIRDALEQNVQALEQRYARPNWFKIAAGFAKPQLGGFTASLGSAAEAMGDTLEKQREQLLPISQMRTQIAQTNLILDQNKTAAEMVEERKRLKKPITPEFVGEVVARAPDSPVAKSLQSELTTRQKEQEITANLQRNALTAMAESRAAGLEVDPQVYINAGLKPPNDTTDTFYTPEKKPEGKIQTLPNGARVNEEGAMLASLGVPIISGVRTKEEQQKLYDDRGKNPNPVAVPGTSKHETGQAYDVDSKTMTDEHRGMLKALGYRQPDPKGDPNHWEKISQSVPPTEGKAVAQSLTKESEGPIYLSTADQTPNTLYTKQQISETKNLSAQELNKIANSRFTALESSSNDMTYGQMQHAIDAMIHTIKNNEKLTQDVVNPLAKNEGILGGILNAAEAGMGFNVSGMTGNIHFPASQAIIGSYTREQKNHLNLLDSQAARIAKLQQQMNNVNPSSIRAGEVAMYERAAVHPETQGENVMLYNLYYTRLNNEMLREMYVKANQIYHNEDPKYKINPNSRSPMMDIMTSPVMGDIEKRYAKKFERLNNQFQKQLEK